MDQFLSSIPERYIRKSLRCTPRAKPFSARSLLLIGATGSDSRRCAGEMLGSRIRLSPISTVTLLTG